MMTTRMRLTKRFREPTTLSDHSHLHQNTLDYRMQSFEEERPHLELALVRRKTNFFSSSAETNLVVDGGVGDLHAVVVVDLLQMLGVLRNLLRLLIIPENP